MEDNEIVKDIEYNDLIEEYKIENKINNYIMQTLKLYDIKIVDNSFIINSPLNDLLFDTKHMELIDKIKYYIKKQEIYAPYIKIQYKNNFYISFEEDGEIFIRHNKSNNYFEYDEYIENKHNIEKEYIYE